MTNPSTDEGRNPLEAAFSSEIATLEESSAGPVDPTILAILDASKAPQKPEEIWSAEAFDKVEASVRSGQAGVSVEALTLYLGKYLVEQTGGTWGVMKISPEGWPSTRILFGVYNAEHSSFAPVYSWARHVVDGDDWIPLSSLLLTHPPSAT
ncbi:MAG: hypothetical protein ACI38U_08850 [Corynebacterium sp.]|uniref:hypothetical protein n=1 Tax=unclassified Corynebacterium TaxID=2624378 RepID=UPI00095991BF|nr:hypothetical protein [Corynebacterium sp. CNJ-954]OLT49974.1 hypothetical protein BJF89_11010 [Corynebacterium sp. CNJ-954]